MPNDKYDISGLPVIEAIIDLYKVQADIINDLPMKDYLKDSIISGIVTETDFPREVVSKTIELIFLAGSV